MARADVDRELCTSNEECVRAAPTAFELDDEGISVPTEDAGAVPEDQLVLAARRCPVQAITIAADDGAIIYAGFGVDEGGA